MKNFLVLLVFVLIACDTQPPETPQADGPQEPSKKVEPNPIPEVDFSVQGHRGAKAIYSENTLPSFEHAILAGTNQIEFDIHYTKNDELVIYHDPVISRDRCLTKDGKKLPKEKIYIRDLTLAQVQEFDCGSLQHKNVPKNTSPGAKIPSVDELLKLVSQHPKAQNVILKWDIKSEQKQPRYYPTAQRIAHLISEKVEFHNVAYRSVFSAFDEDVLRELKAINSNYKIALLTGWILTQKTIEQAESLGVDTISPFQLVLLFQGPKKWTQRFKDKGIKMVPYTVNKESYWKKLLEASVYGIITDDPESLRQYYDSRKKSLISRVLSQAEIDSEIERDITPYLEKHKSEEALIREIESLL